MFKRKKNKSSSLGDTGRVLNPRTDIVPNASNDVNNDKDNETVPLTTIQSNDDKDFDFSPGWIPESSVCSDDDDAMECGDVVGAAVLSTKFIAKSVASGTTTAAIGESSKRGKGRTTSGSSSASSSSKVKQMFASLFRSKDMLQPAVPSNNNLNANDGKELLSNATNNTTTAESIAPSVKKENPTKKRPFSSRSRIVKDSVIVGIVAIATIVILICTVFRNNDRADDRNSGFNLNQTTSSKDDHPLGILQTPPKDLNIRCSIPKLLDPQNSYAGYRDCERACEPAKCCRVKNVDESDSGHNVTKNCVLQHKDQCKRYAGCLALLGVLADNGLLGYEELVEVNAAIETEKRDTFYVEDESTGSNNETSMSLSSPSSSNTGSTAWDAQDEVVQTTTSFGIKKTIIVPFAPLNIDDVCSVYNVSRTIEGYWNCQEICVVSSCCLLGTKETGGCLDQNLDTCGGYAACGSVRGEGAGGSEQEDGDDIFMDEIMEADSTPGDTGEFADVLDLEGEIDSILNDNVTSSTIDYDTESDYDYALYISEQDQSQPNQQLNDICGEGGYWGPDMCAISCFGYVAHCCTLIQAAITTTAASALSSEWEETCLQISSSECVNYQHCIPFLASTDATVLCAAPRVTISSPMFDGNYSDTLATKQYDLVTKEDTIIPNSLNEDLVYGEEAIITPYWSLDLCALYCIGVECCFLPSEDYGSCAADPSMQCQEVVHLCGPIMPIASSQSSPDDYASSEELMSPVTILKESEYSLSACDPFSEVLQQHSSFGQTLCDIKCNNTGCCFQEDEQPILSNPDPTCEAWKCPEYGFCRNYAPRHACAEGGTYGPEVCNAFCPGTECCFTEPQITQETNLDDHLNNMKMYHNLMECDPYKACPEYAFCENYKEYTQTAIVTDPCDEGGYYGPEQCALTCADTVECCFYYDHKSDDNEPLYVDDGNMNQCAATATGSNSVEFCSQKQFCQLFAFRQAEDGEGGLVVDEGLAIPSPQEAEANSTHPCDDDGIYGFEVCAILCEGLECCFAEGQEDDDYIYYVDDGSNNVAPVDSPPLTATTVSTKNITYTDGLTGNYDTENCQYDLCVGKKFCVDFFQNNNNNKKSWFHYQALKEDQEEIHHNDYTDNSIEDYDYDDDNIATTNYQYDDDTAI